MKVYLLVGNIGSGKSVIARKYALRDNALVLNNDSLLSMLHGGEYNYRQELSQAYKLIFNNMYMSSLHISGTLGVPIVIDRTNMSVSERRRFIERIEKEVFEIICLDLGTGNEKDLERRIKNNRKQSAQIWEKVFYRMKERYEEPTPDEGFSKIIKIDNTKFTSHYISFDEIYTEIEKINNLYKKDQNMIIIKTNKENCYLNTVYDFLHSNGIMYDFVDTDPFDGLIRDYKDEYKT